MKKIETVLPPLPPINGMRQEDYTIATRTTKISFKGQPCCLGCQYFRTKTGLYDTAGGLERYQHTVCVLTYEPLDCGKIGEMVGDCCPLEFLLSESSEHSDK